MPENDLPTSFPGDKENPKNDDSIASVKDSTNKNMLESLDGKDTFMAEITTSKLDEGVPVLSNTVIENSKIIDQSPIESHPFENSPDQTFSIPFRTNADNWSALEIKPSDLGRNLGQEEEALIKQVADQLSLALENAHLFQQTQQLASELQILYEMAHDLSERMDITYVVEAVYKHTVRLLDIDYFSLGLFSNQDHSLFFPYAVENGSRLDSKTQSLSNAFIEYVIQTKNPLLIPANVETNCKALNIKYEPQDEGAIILSLICVPLILRNNIIGIIYVSNHKEEDSFTEHHLSLLISIASQAALAIDNARSYELANQALEEMRELDMLKSQFLANMSHELRTPLNSIIGFSKVILKGIDGPITELQEQDLNAINSSGHHLLRLINDILDFSKIDANKMELSMEEVNLVELIDNVLSTIGGLLKDKPISIIKNLSADIPTIQADPIRIRQVLINLLSNASKFTDQGTITITADTEVNEEGKFFIKVQIIDTGSGIPNDAQDKLFQPFSQVNSSPSRKTDGTGLGLSISKKLIELHGGTIGVTSIPNEGSTFFFTLPLKKELS